MYNMINMHLMSDRSIAIKKLTKEHNGYILRKYWEIELFVSFNKKVLQILVDTS